MALSQSLRSISHKLTDHLGDEMELFKKYLDEMYNMEISKLRKEIFEANKQKLLEEYDLETINLSWRYFNPIPIMNSLNRSSLEMLYEACDAAKDYLKISKE